ncbi:DUF1963 domain-containing protein [Deinococcus oregonensis]|uniref:DUF1963 domain-containing protein n=1 Tax=Deinococcus oregonensis TaxID=1805970 RepID=A0ABV6AYV0_9DEIO
MEQVYLELSQDREHKFYETQLEDRTLTVRYGRIGTSGQNQVKTFATAEEAQASAQKKLSEKRRKGYTDAEPAAAQKRNVEKLRVKLHRLLTPHRDAIEATLRPAVELRLTAQQTTPWNSKVGGIPYLPCADTWPTDATGTPLAFLAQLNFAELPPLPGFPEEGILQFFIGTDDLHGAPGELEPPTQETYRVRYHAQVTPNPDALNLTPPACPPQADLPLPFPPGLDARLTGTLTEHPMSATDRLFSETVGIDFFSEAPSSDPDLMLGEYLEQQYRQTTELGHQLGGYPCFTQQDPRDPAQPHLLLFQLDSDWAHQILWGDSGIANFFIHPDDLARRDFSRVSYHWDCC